MRQEIDNGPDSLSRCHRCTEQDVGHIVLWTCEWQLPLGKTQFASNAAMRTA